MVMQLILTTLLSWTHFKTNKKIHRKKNIITCIYRVQVYKLIMCRWFCIGFIGFMLRGKSLLNDTNLFSPNEYEKKDKIILKYFQ